MATCRSASLSPYFLFFILLHDDEINLSNAVDNQILNGSLRCHRLNAAFCILTQCSSSFYNQLFDLIYVTLFVAFLLPHSLLIKRFRSIFILCSFIENEKMLRVKKTHKNLSHKRRKGLCNPFALLYIYMYRKTNIKRSLFTNYTNKRTIAFDK